MTTDEYVTREIRGLYQGETCNYRVKASCGAPIFKAIPGGEWSSSLDHFNITFVEFEEEDTELAGNNMEVTPDNYWMPIAVTKFIYQMFSVGDMDVMERSYNMEDVKNTPRKGIYSNLDEGYKAFNNIVQGPDGSNGFKENEIGGECENRYVLVSVTAVEDNSALNMKFGSHTFARRPLLMSVRTGAYFLRASLLAFSAIIINQI